MTQVAVRDQLKVDVFKGDASVGEWWDAAYQIPRDLTFGSLLDACKAGQYDKCGQGIGETEAAVFVLLLPGVEGAAAPAVAIDAVRAAELAAAEAEAAAIADAAAAQADAAAAAAEARALAEATRAAQAARAAETGTGYSVNDVDNVAAHLSALDQFEANDVMLDRIRNAIADGRPLTEGQENFMVHETLETELMNEGMIYDDAHAEALKVHPPGRNYDPDVIDQFEEFGPWWREMNGLDPR